MADVGLLTNTNEATICVTNFVYKTEGEKKFMMKT